MKHVTILLFLTGYYVAIGLSAKCMTPDDARYVTSAYPVPDSWLNSRLRWHTGDHFPGPRTEDSTSYFTQPLALFLTTRPNGALMWWLKDKDSNMYTIMTQDYSSILCTLKGAGLHVGWKPMNAESRRSGYCHWDILVHPSDVTMFQLRNAELKHWLSEMGSVFLNRTGLYFDYASNSDNDPANVVDERLKWWKWRKADADQRDMTSLDDQCELGESGYPVFLEEESEIMGRSAGGSSRGKRYVFTSANKLARCGRQWFLYGTKCYKMYVKPPLGYHNTKRICKLLRGKVALPATQRENDYLGELITRYASTKAFWVAATANDRNQPKDDYSGQTLPFANFPRRRRVFRNTQKCAVIDASKRWRATNCNATDSHVLCERDAEVRELPGSARCGKIQQRGVDLRMLQAKEVESSDRIVGGDSAWESQFPWQAAIRFKTGMKLPGVSKKIYHNCGGALIDNCWVLTAAHCFTDRDIRKYIVRLGDLDKDRTEVTEQEFDVERLLIHEEYRSKPSHQNDIALIKLQQKNGQCARLTNAVQPVCLPTRDFSISEDGEKCQVSGWGVTAESQGQADAPTVLQWVTIPTMRNSICHKRYNKRKSYFLPDLMFCAGYKTGGKDSCSGDSGGPYVCRGRNGRYAVAGIVSFGIGCARKSHPGVYTRVTRYMPWIKAKIQSYGSGNFIS